MEAWLRESLTFSLVQYIQTRKVDYVANAKEKLGQAFKVESFNVLTPEVRAYIDRSDTFFVSR